METNTNSSKVIAQTSKMGNTETVVSSAQRIEDFGVALNKYVKEHIDTCVEHAEGSGSYFLRGVDVGNGPSDFEMVISVKDSKPGKRATFSRDLYRINEDGTRGRAVQFSNLKKKLLYPLMGVVVSGKFNKNTKMKVDKALTKKIADAIRADRSAFKLDSGVLTGAVNGVGDIKMVETEKTLKTGKKQLCRQLFIAGKLALEGGQLGVIKSAMVKTGARRNVKDAVAVSNNAVGDQV